MKRAGSRKTELSHITRVDAGHLSGIPGTDSALAVIKINALQVMCGEDAFKLLALPYCFGTKVELEDITLEQIQEIAGQL